MLEKDKRVMEQFKHLLEQKIKVYELKVFGSRARDEAREESDLDVLVIVESISHAIEKEISNCAWEVGFNNDVLIAALPMSIDTLKNTPIRESIFIQNVLRDGITV